MKLKIKVTKEILERSKMCDKKPQEPCNILKNCAIALAVRDIFPNSRVLLGYVEIITPDRDMHNCDLPRVARGFITEFDKSTPEQRVEMEPIEFEIEVPEEVIDQIGIDEAKEIISKSSTLELT